MGKISSKGRNRRTMEGLCCGVLDNLNCGNPYYGHLDPTKSLA